MDKMEKIVSLAKRRGFVYPGSEIYGGITGFWDYGPLGVELKNNIKKEWWKSMVYKRDDVVGIDASIIMNPEVWKASGHLDAFSDPLVECKNCHNRFRVDHLLDQYKDEVVLPKEVSISFNETGARKMLQSFLNEKVQCPNCNKKSWTEPKSFNLMTEVFLGVTEPKQKAYLRGEITQGVFVNFRNVVDSTRIKIPFGIAQIGKAFRNEITPGNFTYRSKEFEQMELEYFIKPVEEESKKLFNYWKKYRIDWYISLGMSKENLRFRSHSDEERAHYARYAQDIEYHAPFGWSEIEGIHHRGDWDLKRHNLQYKDTDTGKVYTPWVIETSGGIDRSTLFFLINAYHEEKNRSVLKLDPKLSPYKVAVFPLLANKEKLITKAKDIFLILKRRLNAVWDDRGNIGKRYYSQDEIGTPWCITVDFQTIEDDTVTIRDRDSTKQERVSVAKLENWFESRL